MTDEQRTDDWFKARLGKVTASRVADVMAKTKTGPAASRQNYAAQLILERLTGEKADSFTNAAMQWGIDTEAEAKAAYAFRNDVAVQDVGFVDHPTVAMSGASPDGLVGEDGLVEIKCPISATHLDVLLSEKVPGKYVTQMQWQMACTGRAWCDFASYDPRMPPEMQLFIKRVVRDDEIIAAMEAEVSAFLDEVEASINELRGKYGKDE